MGNQTQLDGDNPFGGADLPTAHQFKAVWKQPEDVDRVLRAATSDGYTVNVCAGQSPLGDVKVDAQPQQRDVIPADMNRLPFAANTFEYAIVDPPWNLTRFERLQPLFEPIRVVEPDGVVFFNARWIGESRETRIEPPLIVRSDDPWGDISVIVAHRVDPGQRELTHWGAGVDEVPTRPNPLQMATCSGCGSRYPQAESVQSETLWPDEFCSIDCLHEVEAHFGEPLTPVEGASGPYPVFEAFQQGRRDEEVGD